MRTHKCPGCGAELQPKYTPHKKGRGNGWVTWYCKKKGCKYLITKGLRRGEEAAWLHAGWIK